MRRLLTTFVALFLALTSAAPAPQRSESAAAVGPIGAASPAVQRPTASTVDSLKFAVIGDTAAARRPSTTLDDSWRPPARRFHSSS